MLSFILNTYIYIYHHHHQAALLARVFLTLSLSIRPHHPSLPASPLNSILCLSRAIVDFAGRPALAPSYEGVHGRTSLVSSSLFLQQCPACLIRLTWMVLVMGGQWLNSCYFVGCCFQDLFNIARSILEQFPSSFSSRRFIKVRVVHP